MTQEQNGGTSFQGFGGGGRSHGEAVSVVKVRKKQKIKKAQSWFLTGAVPRKQPPAVQTRVPTAGHLSLRAFGSFSLGPCPVFWVGTSASGLLRRGCGWILSRFQGKHWRRRRRKKKKSFSGAENARETHHFSLNPAGMSAEDIKGCASLSLHRCRYQICHAASPRPAA